MFIEVVKIFDKSFQTISLIDNFKLKHSEYVLVTVILPKFLKPQGTHVYLFIFLFLLKTTESELRAIKYNITNFGEKNSLAALIYNQKKKQKGLKHSSIGRYFYFAVLELLLN